MRRVLMFIAVVSFVVLTSAEPALAKGPDQVTITGPGLARPIVLPGPGEEGNYYRLGELVDGSGLFLAMFGKDGSSGGRLMSDAPNGSLGPKYELSYRVPDGATTSRLIRQDLYPQAAGGPVTYTAPGQVVFGTATSGGWYRAPSTFGRLLTAIGVPDGNTATAAPRLGAVGSAPEPATTPTREARWLPIASAALVVVVAISGAAMWFARRRTVAHGSGSSASPASASNG